MLWLSPALGYDPPVTDWGMLAGGRRGFASRNMQYTLLG